MTELAEAAGRRAYRARGFRCVTEEEFVGWWMMALKAPGPTNERVFCGDCMMQKVMAADGLCVLADEKVRVA